MAQRGTNGCKLEYTITEVELMHGNKGPWARVQGYYTAQDRNKNALNVQLRFTAFGVLAERCASVEGQTVNVELDMGGWVSKEGKVYPEYTCTSISRPWGDTGGARPAAARPADPAPAQNNDEDDLPF